MRMAVSLEDGLGLDGDRCMRDTPTEPATSCVRDQDATKVPARHM